MAAMLWRGALSIMFAAMPSRMIRKEPSMIYTLSIASLI
jgi:hypothetical protein